MRWCRVRPGRRRPDPARVVPPSATRVHWTFPVLASRAAGRIEHARRHPGSKDSPARQVPDTSGSQGGTHAFFGDCGDSVGTGGRRSAVSRLRPRSSRCCSSSASSCTAALTVSTSCRRALVSRSRDRPLGAPNGPGQQETELGILRDRDGRREARRATGRHPISPATPARR